MFEIKVVGHGEEAPDQLLANPKNWRAHPKAQQDALTAVQREIGIIAPVVVNRRTGFVVDGHLRVTLAITEGVPMLPVSYCDLSEEEEAIALATYDPITNKATKNEERLKELILEARSHAQDPDTQAFLEQVASDYKINLDDDVGPEPQLDKAVQLREKWGTVPGQLWKIPSRKLPLASHLLLCGNSANGQDVVRLLAGAKPYLMVTDPPYGVEYDSAWRAPYSSGEYSVGEVTGDTQADWSAVYELWQVPVLYVWHGGLHADVVGASLKAIGYELRAQIIWNKSVIVFGRGHYHWKHEPCWYAVKKGHTAHWAGGRSQASVWDCGNSSGAGRTGDEADAFHAAHVSQKPVELFRRPILNHTKPGEIVADPFIGSGTAFVAAEQLGRLCYGVEIEPKYVAVTLERLMEMGLTPELEGR